MSLNINARLALKHIFLALLIITSCLQFSAATTTEKFVNQVNAATMEQNSSDTKLWNLRNADIRAVIDEVSRVTGKNFLVDPHVNGKISIISAVPISRDELYQVFLSMLEISGYAVIPSGKVLKIIPNADARTAPIKPYFGSESMPRGDAMLVQVIPVKYVPADQLVPALRPLMPQWSNISSYGPSNMLILSGRAETIRHMAAIISQVDTSSANGIDMIPLKHALAMDIVNTLKELMRPQPGANNNSRATMAADDRSNSILLSGSRTERIKYRILISRLDKESSQGKKSNTKVIYLNYLRAEDVVPILAGVAQANFSGIVGTTIGTVTRPEIDSTNPLSNFANGGGGGMYGGQIAATQKTAMPNTTPTATQNEGNTKPTVQIIAEPNTNSIILNAPAALIATLNNVVEQLDVRPAQLLIEALVAEIDESDVKELGIEWGSIQQNSKQESVFTPGFAIINSKTQLKDFQSQLYALVRDKKANILSTPSVVVLDNRQAKIAVGRQLSVQTTTYPNNAGGSTPASPYSTFDRVNVALHLYVRPQITRGSGIQLDIDQGNDTVDPATINNTENPIFKISSIVTSVHVNDGGMVVLGGLIQDSLANTDVDLPILKDIPGIGKLFQHNIRNREKRVLMVFIKPLILNNKNVANSATSARYNKVREHQLNWLRDEPFEQSNDEVILPSRDLAILPKPFSSTK